MSPLEQFEIFPIFVFPFIFTNSSLILLIGFIFVYFYNNIQIKLIPKNWQQIFEGIYKISFELAYVNLNQNGRCFFPIIFIIFFVLLLLNLIGTIPYSFTITSHLIVTFSFALFIFSALNFIGIRKHKIKFFNLFLPNGISLALAPILVPIELISYIFRVVSLPVRLFANMMAGHTLLKVIAGFAWVMVNLKNLLFLIHFIPLVLLVVLIGLEFGVAIIQAYVFTILTCIYLNDVLNLH